jgi:hypothetical protein
MLAPGASKATFVNRKYMKATFMYRGPTLIGVPVSGTGVRWGAGGARTL